MAIGRKPTGGYDAAFPVTLPDGTTGFATAVATVDAAGNIVSSGGSATTIADGADVAEGATTAAAYTDATGAASGVVVGLLKGLFVALRGILRTGGDVASGAADSGNPVKTGGFASMAAPTAVAIGQRINSWLTPNGASVVAPQTSVTGLATASFADVNLVNDTYSSGRPAGTIPFVFNGTAATPQRGDTIGSYVVSKGGANIATAQVTLGSTATLLVAARAGRQEVTIFAGGTTDYIIGPTGVTGTTGIPVKAGVYLTIKTAAAIYAVGNGVVVAVLENY